MIEFGKPDSQPNDWQTFEGHPSSPLTCSKCQSQASKGHWRYKPGEEFKTEFICDGCRLK